MPVATERASWRYGAVIGLLKFPTLAAAESFVGDVEYAPFAKARQNGSVSQFYVIDDTDAAGTLPYLPKG
ncbi:hypothetical protein WDZ92_29290 [Nostoc sp. NIES-2111]